MNCKPGQRIKEWCERIRKEEIENKNFIWVPSTSDYEVVECLVELFLGEGWYAEGGWTSPPQVNTIILDEILNKYCRDYRKKKI